MIIENLKNKEIAVLTRSDLPLFRSRLKDIRKIKKYIKSTINPT